MNFQNLFEKLGLENARWQWRARRWDQAVERWRGNLRGERQRVVYRNKFCPQCRTLMDRDDKVCPNCGARVGSWHVQAAGRAVASFIPGGSTVTGTLIFVNVLIFGLGILFGGLGAIFSPPNIFIKLMSMISPAFLQGQYWRIITYGYLHFGWMHILFNMFALKFSGDLLEEEVGKARFFVVYTLCMLGGGVFNICAAKMNIQYMAGASGAVFGLIGFGAAYGHFLGGPRGEALRNFFLRWVIYALIFTFLVPGISVSAHLGGLTTGGLLGYLIENERRGRARQERIWRLANRICLSASVGAFLWMLVYLFSHTT